METVAAPSAVRPVAVEPWPSELPLKVLVILASIGIWAMLVFSILGIVYALMIGVFVFFAHVAFVTHVRGSAVKLGPAQFPELHARVVELAAKAGLTEVPDAYLMQAGGSLNALATKLFRGRMIVLFSDLLDACGDDDKARDMVIGHELGHLRSGHLDLFWLKAPGTFFPFLGSAYSRACEYTCDRWGAALSGDRGGATRGLAILAAGGKMGPSVDLPSYVAQREDLDTGWMTIGKWLSGYPPLSARIEAIEPALAGAPFVSARGPVRAVLILAAFFMVPTVAAMGAFAFWAATMKPLLEAADEEPDLSDYPALAALVEEESAAEPLPTTPEQIAAAADRARFGMAAIAELVVEHHAATGLVLGDDDEIAAAWSDQRPGEALPLDPFDGLRFGVDATETGLRLYSSGPDGTPTTDDDLIHEIELPAAGG
ncbi:MAG: hypothetical protein AMXMBFR36_19100 [Acidobacteriota bacterium]